MAPNSYCCVPECRSWKKRSPQITFHKFPKEGQIKVKLENKLGLQELVDRRKVWIHRLRMGKKVSQYMRVCSLHFTEADFINTGKAKFKKSLKNIAIPSTNLPLTYEVEERERASEDGLFEKEVHNEKEMEVAEGLIALFNNQTVYVGPKRIQNCESLREKNTECNTLPSKDPNP